MLLKQDIEPLGRMGEVVEVARGYARNYLMPRGLAAGVTRGGLKDIKEQQRVLEIKAERERERLQGVAEKITGKRVAIKARCSATGKLFGSITGRQLASEIEAVTGEEVDRHKLVFDERVRTVGIHHALLKLHPDVHIDIEFEVEGEGFVAEEPVEEEAEGAAAVPAEGAPEPGFPEEVVPEEGVPEALPEDVGEPASSGEVIEPAEASEPAESESQPDSEME
ncbi:MAG: 50S ribosomal protein L9 [Actinobacteria bacterium]|nr:50S ribosomal protein L9 [Actinomycetota bacterium]